MHGNLCSLDATTQRLAERLGVHSGHFMHLQAVLEAISRDLSMCLDDSETMQVLNDPPEQHEEEEAFE